jgi:SWI/SNF-related matrix-associated actin-dependent regulator of chromatin subfamily A protein 2/4
MSIFRINNRILNRMRILENLPVNISEHLRVKAEIELRALRLLNFQNYVRGEVLGHLKVY